MISTIGRPSPAMDGQQEESDVPWYAVRCVFEAGWPPRSAGKTYEERITLWSAQSAANAIARAEAEDLVYAAVKGSAPSTYLELAQSFELFDVPGDGAEVFSLMRDSDLGGPDYLDTFFDSGSERQRPL